MRQHAVTRGALGQQRSGEAATFVYDAMGNVLVKAHEGAAPVTMAYDAANQVATAQQGAATTTLTQHAAGNLTVENAGGALTTNTWDGENRLTAVAFPDGTSSAYTYAPDGLRRSAQEAGGASTTFVFDGEDYLQERTAGGTVRYLTVGGEVVAEKRDGARRLYVPDPLGSTVALVNAAGAVSDTFRYWPYGEEAARTGTTPTPFRYVGTAGYYRDRLASIYVRKRHLRVDLARWASADPLGWDAGDLNLYRYVGNRPTVWVDPSGLQALDPRCFAGERWGCGPGQSAVCTALCLREFNNADQRCWTIPVIRVCCCQCYPCERHPGVGNADSAVRGCILPGELYKRRSVADARKCRGTHYTYTVSRNKRTRIVTVLCCECTDNAGKVRIACSCQ